MTSVHNQLAVAFRDIDTKGKHGIRIDILTSLVYQPAKG